MARDYAKLKTGIWVNARFRALTGAAQRAYTLAYSQAGVSMCGVVSYTPKRWAGFASDTSPAKITKAVRELQEACFVLVDPETEELLVRSFVRHDGVLDSPNLVIAMWKDVSSIHSVLLREVFLFELPDTIEFPEGYSRPPDDPLQEGFREGLLDNSNQQPHLAPTPTTALVPFGANFDEFWDEYPRRSDKSHALKMYSARLHEGARHEDLVAAARHYARACRANGTDRKYMKMAKTFLAKAGPWTEWVAGAPDGEGSPEVPGWLVGVKHAADAWSTESPAAVLEAG